MSDEKGNKGYGSKSKEITYYVNGEEFVTDKKKLTVGFILEQGGFTPVSDYELTRDDGDKKFTDYDLEIPLHKDESFTATYKGVTEVS